MAAVAKGARAAGKVKDADTSAAVQTILDKVPEEHREERKRFMGDLLADMRRRKVQATGTAATATQKPEPATEPVVSEQPDQPEEMQASEDEYFDLDSRSGIKALIEESCFKSDLKACEIDEKQFDRALAAF